LKTIRLGTRAALDLPGMWLGCLSSKMSRMVSGDGSDTLHALAYRQGMTRILTSPRLTTMCLHLVTIATKFYDSTEFARASSGPSTSSCDLSCGVSEMNARTITSL